MILTIKNIGKVKEAEIDLSGITVIAGENDTGKSTIGKILFSIFNSFYHINEQIIIERTSSILKILGSMSLQLKINLTNEIFLEAETLTRELFNLPDNTDRHLITKLNIRNFLINIHKSVITDLDEAKRNKYIDDIVKIIEIPSIEIMRIVLQKNMESEFYSQINNIYITKDIGIIGFKTNDINVEITICENKISKLTNIFILHTNAIYIDDPFVIDDLDIISGVNFRRPMHADHRLDLKSLLSEKKNAQVIQTAIEEILINKKFETIYNKINSVCEGEIISQSNIRYGYGKGNNDKLLDIKNVSAGLKTFIIIKTLLKNGNLDNGGTLILDEPEIHLHPEWQLLLAELIVLLQIEFELHILLNTHSPYFLHAIEIYSAKHDIINRCRYYLAENSDNYSIINDVTNDIESIYTKLANPFQKLEDERYTDD